MVLQKLWVSQNFSQISRVSQSRFFSGYMSLAVSFFFIPSVSESRIFARPKGSQSLEIPLRLFVCLFLNGVFSSLDFEFHL